jgi:hypothetical protein
VQDWGPAQLVRTVEKVGSGEWQLGPGEEAAEGLQVIRGDAAVELYGYQQLQ